MVMVVWARYVVHTLLMAGIFLPQSGLGVLRTKRPLLQTMRALCLLGTSLFFTTGLQYIPLAEATAVNFLAPVLVTALSVPLLGEHVTRGQWIAVICGFIGVLIIVHPGGDLFTPAVLLPFCSALFFCFYQLLTRKLSNIDSPTTSNFFAGLCNTLVMSVLVPFFWQVPNLWAWLDDGGAGGLRDDGSLVSDSGVPLRRAGVAGAVRLLPDCVCRSAGLAAVFPHADPDHRGRDRGDLLQRVGGSVATESSVGETKRQAWNQACRGKGNYSVTVGILRGAMKYIQVRAMKYIAGIRVNSTV